MFEQIIRYKYFFHIVAVVVIITVTILFIIFSGNSAETSAIEAVTGKEFVITLEANATTGYEWQLADPIDYNLVNLVRSEYAPYKTGLTGSGGKSVWTFKAVQAGKARIAFKYIRPWEKDTLPAQEMMYTVNIRK